jgi:hypothetical protein
MEENYNISPKLDAVKEFLKSWRFWRPFLGVFIGGLAGFLFYYFVGCTSGSCAITGNPCISTLWGGLMGFFVVSSPCSKGKC